MATENYKDPFFEEHEKTVKKYEKTLTDSMKKVNNAVEESINKISSALGSEEELKLKFKVNANLGQLYDEYKNEISKYDKKNQEIAEISETIQENLGISSEKLNEAIELIEKRKKIEQEISNIIAERDKNPVDSDEYDNLQLRVWEKEEELKKLTKKINDDATVFSAVDKYDKDNDTKDALDEISKKREENVESAKKVAEYEKQIGNEISSSNQKLQKRERIYTQTVAALKASFDVVKGFAKKWAEVDEIVTKYGRSVGISAEQTNAYRKNVLDNFGQMAGRLGMTVQEIMKFQEQYAKNTGRAVMLTNEQVESLAGLSKITSDIATETMVSNMDNFGASVDTASGYLAQAYARASQVGLNAAKTSETFANNIKMASKYSFREGINGISKMTMLSQRLKFNIESMSGALDKFSTIEGAISTSANIQLLGGAYAAQFSNPMQAMGEALLDAESFTKRIVDTFSNFAYFDKEKGMVDMNPFEKQRMKLAAQELGINYDEAWNIATQTAKAKVVEKELGANANNLDESNKEYLKNLAQYDTDKKAFYVTYYDNDGNQQKKDIRDITSNEQVESIRRTNNKEEILQDDVHQIKGLLHEYVKKKVGETKTVIEIDKGIKERGAIGAANAMDPALSRGKGIANGLSEAGSGMFGGVYGLATVGGIVSTIGAGGFLGSRWIKNKFIGVGRGNVTTGGNNIPSSGTKPSSMTFSQRRSLINKYGSASNARAATKFSNLSKVGGNALKFGGKALKFGGAALGAVTAAAEIGTSIYGAVKTNKNYKENIKKIDSDRSLSSEEKAKAKYDAKKTKNKATGKAIGSTVGAIIGGAIGLIGGPAGVAIGAGIGASIGKWIGGKTGSAVTKKPKGSGGTSSDYTDSSNTVQGNTTQGDTQEQTVQNSKLETDVHSIYELLSSGKLNSKVICVTNHTTSSDNKLAYNSNDSRLSYNSINNSNSSYDYGISSTKISTEPMVISKPTVGTKTYIKEEKSSNVNNLSTGNINIEPINLSVNGSIKLVGDKNVQTSIDVNKLFDNNEFNSKLVGIIAECLRTNTLKGRMVSSNNTSLT